MDGRGTSALTAALDELGVETVDHVGGLAGLLEDDDYDVGRLHLPDVLGLDVRPRAFPQVRDLLRAADDRDLSVNLLRAPAVEGTDRDPTRGDPSFSVGEVDVYALGPADWSGAGRDPRDHAETAGQTTTRRASSRTSTTRPATACSPATPRTSPRGRSPRATTSPARSGHSRPTTPGCGAAATCSPPPTPTP